VLARYPAAAPVTLGNLGLNDAEQNGGQFATGHGSLLVKERDGAYASLWYGDWSRIVIGVRLGMTTIVLRERYMLQKQYDLFCAMRCSIRATHPETFVRPIGQHHRIRWISYNKGIRMSGIDPAAGGNYTPSPKAAEHQLPERTDA
jgi:hypothetical protein